MFISMPSHLISPSYLSFSRLLFSPSRIYPIPPLVLTQRVTISKVIRTSTQIHLAPHRRFEPSFSKGRTAHRRQKKMVNWGLTPLNDLRRIFIHKKQPTMPSIICENCHHQQSQETTNNAVLASLMTLNAYFLAVLNDLETQYGTIRSQGIGIVVCVLLGGTLLGSLGFGFWLVFFILPWALGLWELWWCLRRIFETLVNSLAEDNGNIGGQSEAEQPRDHTD